METHNNTGLKNMTYNGQKVNKWIHNDVQVYSAGSTVTYYVDADTVYTEDINSGDSCLAPKTFTPAIAGRTFVGWRQDTTPSSDVLSTLAMGNEPVTLYAVFQTQVTLTYYMGATTTPSAQTLLKYYNNGNFANPKFTIAQPTIDGWISRGWGTSAAGNAAVAYSAISQTEFATNTIVYALYSKSVTIKYYDNSTTVKTTSGTRYYNSAGNYANPSFTLTQTTRSGWTKRGWGTALAANAAVVYADGVAFTLAEDTTLYGLYQSTITVTTYNNSTTPDVHTGTAYLNSRTGLSYPKFTIAPANKAGWTFVGWTINGGADDDVVYTEISNTQFTTNMLLYALYKQDVTVNFVYRYNGVNANVTEATSVTVYYNSSGNKAGVGTAPTVNTSFMYFGNAIGWATSTSNKAGVVCALEGDFTATSATTFYAVWKKGCTITYAGNGATAGTMAADTRYVYLNCYNGTTVTYDAYTFKECAFTKTNASFIGWTTSSTGTAVWQPGAALTESPTNLTITAQWREAVVYWIKDGTAQAGYPSTYNIVSSSQLGSSFVGYLKNVSIVGTQEGNAVFNGVTAAVATQGHKYMDVTVSSYNTKTGVLDKFEVGGTELKTKLGTSANISSPVTFTVDVSAKSTVTIALIITAWAWGNWASLGISSIKFYS